MRSITLTYSEGLLRRAIWAFWWRSTGIAFLGTLGFLFALLIYLFATGDRSWRIGVLGSIVGGGVGLAAVLYVVHFRRTISRFRRSKSKEVTFAVGIDSFRFTSDIGSSEMSWATIIKVWRFPEFWLLFYSPAQFTILPLADVDAGTQSVILEGLRTRGAEID